MLKDVLQGSREVKAENWTSRRLLLAEDRVGFSMHDTVLKAGTTTRMWYRNHVEAVYCIAGEGQLEDLDNDQVYPVGPGTLYVLDGHEKHVLTAITELRMVCVFNPPLVGAETHDADGVYPLLTCDDAPRGRA